MVRIRYFAVKHRLNLFVLSGHYLIVLLGVSIKGQFSRVDSIARNLTQSIIVIIVASVFLLEWRKVPYFNVCGLELSWPAEQLFGSGSVTNIETKNCT